MTAAHDVDDDDDEAVAGGGLDDVTTISGELNVLADELILRTCMCDIEVEVMAS